MKPIQTLAFALLLQLGCASLARSEWVRIVESEHVDFYLDAASIKRDGHLRQVWELQNLKQRDQDGELSRHARTEYDCSTRRTRILLLLTHVGPMAQGDVLLRIQGPLPWHAISPNTVDEAYLMILCLAQSPERLTL